MRRESDMSYHRGMYKTQVRAHFGTFKAAADALNIGKSSVSDWPDLVPEGAAYKLQVITRNALVVDPTLYPKLTLAMRRAAGRRNRRLAIQRAKRKS